MGPKLFVFLAMVGHWIPLVGAMVPSWREMQIHGLNVADLGSSPAASIHLVGSSASVVSAMTDGRLATGTTDACVDACVVGWRY